MTQTPLVSVILPAYNAELFVSAAVSSILMQSYSNFELIIINDCSTDSTPKLLSELAATDQRIQIIDAEENAGVAQSLNRGIDKAQGKYIARMDADDISLPDRLRQQVLTMENDDSLVVCGTNVEIISEDDARMGFRTYSEADKEIKRKILIANPFAHPTVMIRKSALLTHNLRYSNQYPRCEDYHLWLRLAKYGSFRNIQEVHLRYRIPTTSLKSTASKEMLQDTLRLKKSYLKAYLSAPAIIRFGLEKALTRLPGPILLQLFKRVVIRKSP